MSLSAGLIAANIYYIQPLLHLISLDLKISESSASGVALETQLGYAIGLLVIIPLGDKYMNQRILRIDFLVLILALLGAALSFSLWMLIISSFLVGFTSTIPHLFVPMTARMADDKNR